MEWNFGEVILRAIENEKNRQTQDRQFNQSLSQSDRHFDVSMEQRQQEFKQNLALNQADMQFRHGPQFAEQKRATGVSESQGWAHVANASRATDIQGGYLGLAQSQWLDRLQKERAMNPLVDAMFNPNAYEGMMQTEEAIRKNPYRGAMIGSMLPIAQATAQRASFPTSKMQDKTDLYLFGDRYPEALSKMDYMEQLKWRAMNWALPADVVSLKKYSTETDPLAKLAKQKALTYGMAGRMLQGQGTDIESMFRGIGYQGPQNQDPNLAGGY